MTDAPLETATARDANVPAARPCGVVAGDRCCDACGASLFGRPIRREPRYDLRLATCPECGRVAPLQTHARLEHWERRWTVLLAGLWLWFAAFALLGGSGVLFALSAGTSAMAARPLAIFVEESFERGLAEDEALRTLAAGGRADAFAVWLSRHDAAELFRAAGGWSGAVGWESLNILWVLVGLGGAIGVAWSMIGVGLGVRGRATWMLVVLVIMTFFALMVMGVWRREATMSSYSFAVSRVSPVLIVICLASAATSAGAGLFAGRAFMRGVATFVLPRRLRTSLGLQRRAVPVEISRA